MSQQDIGNLDDTGTSENNSQATPEKTYSQKEFDDHSAKLKSAIARKYEKQFGDLGDIEELRQLKADKEARSLEESKKRGDFEKVLQTLAASKDEEIRKRLQREKETLLSEEEKFNALFGITQPELTETEN